MEKDLIFEKRCAILETVPPAGALLPAGSGWAKVQSESKKTRKGIKTSSVWLSATTVIACV